MPVAQAFGLAAVIGLLLFRPGNRLHHWPLPVTDP